MNHNKQLLVRRLVATQFPQWKDLSVRPVVHSRWDNRIFHLGDYMLVRMPSEAEREVKLSSTSVKTRPQGQVLRNRHLFLNLTKIREIFYNCLNNSIFYFVLYA